ncbi:hypothetical protein ADUPG1_013204, partial [Aduncisulcus paluster]
LKHALCCCLVDGDDDFYPNDPKDSVGGNNSKIRDEETKRKDKKDEEEEEEVEEEEEDIYSRIDVPILAQKSMQKESLSSDSSSDLLLSSPLLTLARFCVATLCTSPSIYSRSVLLYTVLCLAQPELVSAALTHAVCECALCVKERPRIWEHGMEWFPSRSDTSPVTKLRLSSLAPPQKVLSSVLNLCMKLSRSVCESTLAQHLFSATAAVTFSSSSVSSLHGWKRFLPSPTVCSSAVGGLFRLVNDACVYMITLIWGGICGSEGEKRGKASSKPSETGCTHTNDPTTVVSIDKEQSKGDCFAFLRMASSTGKEGGKAAEKSHVPLHSTANRPISVISESDLPLIASKPSSSFALLPPSVKLPLPPSSFLQTLIPIIFSYSPSSIGHVVSLAFVNPSASVRSSFCLQLSRLLNICTIKLQGGAEKEWNSTSDKELGKITAKLSNGQGSTLPLSDDDPQARMDFKKQNRLLLSSFFKYYSFTGNFERYNIKSSTPRDVVSLLSHSLCEDHSASVRRHSAACLGYFAIISLLTGRHHQDTTQSPSHSSEVECSNSVPSMCVFCVSYLCACACDVSAPVSSVCISSVVNLLENASSFGFDVTSCISSHKECAHLVRGCVGLCVSGLREYHDIAWFEGIIGIVGRVITCKHKEYKEQVLKEVHEKCKDMMSVVDYVIGLCYQEYLQTAAAEQTTVE